MALNPRRIDPYNSLAVMAAEEGRWDEAAARYEALLEIAPDFADVRRSLGEAYRALGRKEDAWREWQAAVELAPGQGLALADMCMSAYQDGAIADAEALCERAVQARPDLPETHLSMGLVARALQRHDRARAELTEEARLFPRGSPGGRRGRYPGEDATSGLAPPWGAVAHLALRPPGVTVGVPFRPRASRRQAGAGR